MKKKENVTEPNIFNNWYANSLLKDVCELTKENKELKRQYDWADRAYHLALRLLEKLGYTWCITVDNDSCSIEVKKDNLTITLDEEVIKEVESVSNMMGVHD